MVIEPKGRATAKELLEDVYFKDDSIPLKDISGQHRKIVGQPQLDKSHAQRIIDRKIPHAKDANTSKIVAANDDVLVADRAQGSVAMDDSSLASNSSATSSDTNVMMSSSAPLKSVYHRKP